VADLVAESGCQIYLWTTQRFLPDAFDVFKAWGVKYHCELIWVKPTGFTPFSFQFNTEFCLFGYIGRFEFGQAGIPVCFKADVREHSRKPDEFYDVLMKCSMEPRIDLFSRESHQGFTAWGDEAGKFDDFSTRKK
jgi:N6-adenosine-specific RNA methylase IME4